MDKEEINWVIGISSGIPFLFCPAELAPLWDPTATPSGDRVVDASSGFSNEAGPVTNYDRACDLAKHYVQKISFESGEALLLGEEIPFATWIDATKFTGGYIVIPESWTDEEPNYHDLVMGMTDEAFIDTELEISATQAGFILFPATDRIGDENSSTLYVNCAPGRYAVSLAFWASNDVEFRALKVEKLS